VVLVKHYRSRIRIYFEILETIRLEGRAPPTHILYRANLSHERLQRYLAELKQVGAIEELVEDGRRWYRLTAKGANLLAALRRVIEFMEALGLPC